MPDVKDLGRRVKAKYPGAYDDLADDDLGRRVKAKYPGAYDDFTDIPRQSKSAPMMVESIGGPAPQAEPPGFLENLQTGIARGFQNYFVDPFLAIGEAVENAKTGNYVPAAQIAELAGRGAASLGSAAAAGPYLAGPAYAEERTVQEPQIQAVKQQQEARRAGNAAFQANRQRELAISEQEARDQSLGGRITRGAASLAVGAIPAIVAGIATGGSLPAIAGVTALQSAGEPENLALNVAGAVTPLPVGKLVAPILRRIRGAKGVEAAAQEAAGFGAETPRASPSLAKAIGQDAFDDTKVAVEDLGLQHVPQPNRPANAFPVRRDIPVEDITLSRDNLSRGRMFQAEEALQQGVKGEGETFTTPGGNQRAVEPIQVVPDPQNPGKFIVEGDGNHRVALLKLQGNNELIPVKSFETEAQSAAVNEATAALRENYYNAPMEMPTLGEGGFEAPGLSVSYGEPKRYAGAAGPRITEQGFVEGSNPGVVAPEERTGILKTLTALWKAGLLTRPNTHLKNIGGNAGFALSEEAARIPGAIADIVVSPITGRRTFTGPSLGAIARSAYEAATRGRREAWQIIKNGVSDADAVALQLKELNSPSKILNTYVNGVFRLLNAEDRIFKVYAYRRALEDRARSIALTEIRSGEIARGQYGERVRELVQNTPEDLAAASIGDAEAATTYQQLNRLAKADAEVATFTNPNLVSGAVTAGRRFLETTEMKGGKVANAGLDVVLPFDKTPTNIVARLLEYAGAGFGNSAHIAATSIINKSMSAAEQRAFSQSFGRASIGSGLIVLGAILYKKGLMTGFKEDDPSRRERDEAAGRIPGSILVNGEWHQVVGFAPNGNLMAIGATIQRESDQERDDTLKAILEAGTQAVGEQPLLAGAQQIAGALRNPGTVASRTLGGFAASAVPGVVSDVAQSLDTTRRANDTLYRQVAGRIPILRNTLPERPDVLGQSVPVPFPVNPFKSTIAQEQTNPLFAELVRLDQGISGFQKKKDESEEEHARKVSDFGQLYGQYGLSLINYQPYQNASDEAKREMFHLFNERAKLVVTENEERFAQAKLSPAIIFQAFRESELRKRQKTLQRRTP